MERKAASEIMLTLLLISMLTVAFNVQHARASGTIYIRSDGSVDPSDAPISSVDNVTYVLTGNIYDSIVVQRDNIVIGGAGYAVQGTGSGYGIGLTGRSNVTIKNTNIRNFLVGILLWNSSNHNSIVGNNITSNNNQGIYLYLSSFNTISGNNVTNNTDGILLGSSSNYNSIVGNNITAQGGDGILLFSSSNNCIYHNNFIDNSVQVYSVSSANVWDDGYPSGGNYWSDYNGSDSFHGSYQNMTGGDGVWDSPYVIDENNRDNYPLTSPYEYWSSPIPGDINRDTRVNYDDLFSLAIAFGSTSDKPRWNPKADINGDGKINYKDLLPLAVNYGKTYP